MATKDHGFWRLYIPPPPPVPEDGSDPPRPNIPSGALFLKRDSDGKDWYDHVHDDTQFEKTTVKCVVEVKGRDESGDPVVRVAAVEADRLFPQDGQLIEMLDEKREQNEAALIEEFANHKFDFKTGKVGERWVPKRPPPDDRIMSALEAIMARLDRMEKK